MHDQIDAGERACHGCAVAYVAHLEPDRGRKRRRSPRGMHVRPQGVEDHDLVALGDEPGDDRSADEARTTSDEHPHG